MPSIPSQKQTRREARYSQEEPSWSAFRRALRLARRPGLPPLPLAPGVAGEGLAELLGPAPEV